MISHWLKLCAVMLISLAGGLLWSAPIWLALELISSPLLGVTLTVIYIVMSVAGVMTIIEKKGFSR